MNSKELRQIRQAQVFVGQLLKAVNQCLLERYEKLDHEGSLLATQGILRQCHAWHRQGEVRTFHQLVHLVDKLAIREILEDAANHTAVFPHTNNDAAIGLESNHKKTHRYN